mgnify:CR=1 FL=1
MNRIILLVIIGAVLGVIMILLFQERQRSNINNPIDSQQWTKYYSNPVLQGGLQGSWDEFRADPFVMKDGDFYKMWFGGYKPPVDSSMSGEFKETKGQIGFAESEDGISWRVHPEPVITNGPPGSPDFQIAEVPTVIKDGSRYEMWYSGKASDEAFNNIFHAVSSDRIHWTKDINNPVLRYSETSNAWNSWGVLEPTVAKEGNVYKMWYTGISADNPSNQKSMLIRLGYATSPDGSNWSVHEGNPVLDLAKIPLDDPNSKEAATFNTVFFVLNNGREYELWYFGGASPDIYATSQDGIHWMKQEGEVIPEGKEGEWDSWSVNSPSVVIEADGTYTMWYMGWTIDSKRGLQFGIGHARKSQ